MPELVSVLDFGSNSQDRYKSSYHFHLSQSWSYRGYANPDPIVICQSRVLAVTNILEHPISEFGELLQPCLTYLTLRVPDFLFATVPFLPHHVVTHF